MAVPGFLHAFVDDTSLYPPANLSLADAVAAHRRHRAAPYADLVGPFVVSDIRLPDLFEILDDETEPLPVTVVVTGGAGAIEPAVRWSTRSGLVSLRGLETPLRDEDDLARNAQRVVAAVDQVRDDLGDAPVYVEPPRVHVEPQAGWLGALDVLASAELRVKFRTGGVDADLVPTSTELAAGIDESLDRELAFKCTAGLHRAVHAGGSHGFLNILVATGAAFEGAGRAEVVAVLDDPELDPATLIGAEAELASARRWFTSFGCPVPEEPLEDLVEAGLITC